MEEHGPTEIVYYPSRVESDSRWGLLCTVVGKRSIPADPGMAESAPAAAAIRSADEYRLVYITEGHGIFTDESGDCKDVAEGDAIMLFPGQRYHIIPDRSADWSQTWVGFWADGHTREAVSSFFDPSSPVLGIGVSDTVFDIYGRLMYLAKSEKVGSQEAMGGFIYALLGYVYHKVASLSVSRLKNVDKVQQAQMMIRSDVAAKISPASIASSLGMSYSLLREQFKAVTGVSMAQYQLGQRMNLAKTLLTSSDKSIKEIAFETGYESVSRFCCAFRQSVGLTASDYRSLRKHSD